MMWIFIALLAYFFWALVGIIEKYILDNKVENPFVYFVLSAMAGLITVLLLPWINWATITLTVFGWVMVIALLYVVGTIFYIKALAKEEVTRIAILLQLIPVFSFFLGWLVLKQILTGHQIVAMAILILGGILASLYLRTGKIRFSKAFFLMVGVAFMFSVEGAIIDYTVNFIDAWSLFVLINLITSVVSFALLGVLSIRKDFKKQLKHLNQGLIWIVVAACLFECLGMLFSIKALSLGPMALVYSLEGFQLTFVFIMSLFIAKRWPKALQEELNKSNYLLKFVALILMVVGTVMIYYSE